MNVSRNRNEILDPVDSKVRLPELFRSYTLTTGVDLDYSKKSGVGFMYPLIEDAVAVGLRASIFTQQISGETMATGSRSLFVTARLVLE